MDAVQAGKQCFRLLAFNREAVEWALLRSNPEGLLSQKQMVSGGDIFSRLQDTPFYVSAVSVFWERWIDTSSNQSVQKKFTFLAISKKGNV